MYESETQDNGKFECAKKRTEFSMFFYDYVENRKFDLVPIHTLFSSPLLFTKHFLFYHHDLAHQSRLTLL